MDKMDKMHGAYLIISNMMFLNTADDVGVEEQPVKDWLPGRQYSRRIKAEPVSTLMQTLLFNAGLS